MVSIEIMLDTIGGEDNINLWSKRFVADLIREAKKGREISETEFLRAVEHMSGENARNQAFNAIRNAIAIKENKGGTLGTQAAQRENDHHHFTQ